MKAVLTLAGVLLMTGCGDQVGSSTGTPTSEAAPTSVSLPAAPAHQYSIKDGNEYGYEQAITEADRQQGKAAASLLMFSYLGRKGDTYQVMLNKDNVFSVAECTKPCEFAKIYTFVGIEFSSKEVLKLAPDAILTSVFADAMNGQLEQSHGKQKNVATTLWVDGDAQRLVLTDARTSGVTK